MRCLTIRQPFAWAIFHGKNVENRTDAARWRFLIGERIAVHAGARWHDDTTTDPVLKAALAAWPLPVSVLPRSAVIGTVTITDVHPANGCCQPWGRPHRAVPLDGGGTRLLYDVAHLILTDPQPCPPIPCRGLLGAWTLPEPVAQHLAAGRSCAPHPVSGRTVTPADPLPAAGTGT